MARKKKKRRLVPKDKQTGIPKKYLSGLKGEERKKRIRQLERMKKSGKLLGSLAGDSKKRKTRRSKYTIAFEKRFGKTK